MLNPQAINPRELIPRRADWHLQNWSHWMQNYRVGIGYSNKSSVFISGNSSSVDEMCDEAERRQAMIVDSIVDGLPHIQQLSIHNVYIADVWKFARVDPVQVFVDAAAAFWVLAQRRGLE